MFFLELVVQAKSQNAYGTIRVSIDLSQAGIARDGNFTIANVERETGLSKDLLRMWERRYGFPAPARDANGDRIYPADQVEKLRLLKATIAPICQRSAARW